MKMQTITKKQFNTLTGKHVFRSPFYNKLAGLSKSRGLLVERLEGKPTYHCYSAISKVSRVLGRQFVGKKTLDGKGYAILRVK